jgi:hypothetical protein
MAAAQIKGPSVAPPKGPTGNAIRTPPAVKCVDHDTSTACKSFKQLLDARDKALIVQVLGTGLFKRRTAYVCFRPNDDYFSVVDVDIPEPKAYGRKLDADEEIAHYADDSVPSNTSMREMMERSREADENSEFMDFSDPPAVSQDTKDKWYKDHSKDFVYSVGEVGDYRYQNGIYKGPVDDWGEWTMLASSMDGKQSDPPTWFMGGYAWIERFNRQNGNVAARDDNPEHGHISVDLSSLNVQYKYENASGGMTEYTMQINRLTGRFVEDFKSPNGSNQTSGTCMIFK